MELYINSTGIISPAGNTADENFLSQAPEYDTNHLLCNEPSYTALIPPIQLRRMSKVVRMGVAAAKMCLQNAMLGKPDAISVGTSYGCLYDTEQFLDKMVLQNEQMLSPTAFIQSTHNTVSGQIALLTQCHEHNFTFTHKGHSFEYAAIDAQLYINNHPHAQVLLGGIDEQTDTARAIFQKSNILRISNTTPQSLIYNSKQGTIPGEGAAFFLCNNNPNGNNNLCIKAVDTFVTPDKKEAIQRVKIFLQHQQLVPDDIDLVVLGINGDERIRPFYNYLKASVFNNTAQAVFKHLCGDYPTASSFAIGMLAHFVKHNYLPGFVMLNSTPKQLKRIVLINNYIHYYSCWHLEISA